jgi:iron complex outermembrane receptor protein
LSIEYQPSEYNHLYATYSKGYRVGGLTPISSDPSQPALYPYQPEYSNNIEAGIKNSFWNNKLYWNIALFYSNITNAQVPTLVLPDAVTITKNTGKLTSKGIETELNATPVKGLELNYSFGYTDAQYQRLKIPHNGTETDLKGRRQLFTPDITSMLALQYGYGIQSKQQWQLLIRGEWKYIGTEYFDLANTIRQSPYHLFNAKAGITSNHMELLFWARNISDQHYISYAYDFGAVHLGNPKTYGVTLKTMF